MGGTTQTGLVLERLGFHYDGDDFEVTAEHLARYAAATNDPNPRYVDPAAPGGLVMPPVFPVALFRDVFFTTLMDADNGIDMPRLVHGNQEFTYHRFLKPGDRFHTQATIVGMDEKATGDLYSVKYLGTVNGEPAIEMLAGFFIRLPKGASMKPAEKKPEVVQSEPTYLYTDTVQVALDQTYRYADASGDANPIHVDEEFARAVGLPGIILQGLCSMAMASRGLVTQGLGGDPTRLKTFSVRFASPVRPGDVLTTRYWQEGGAWRFNTINQSGTRVLDAGKATAI
jgi:acyl dehydratase